MNIMIFLLVWAKDRRVVPADRVTGAGRESRICALGVVPIGRWSRDNQSEQPGQLHRSSQYLRTWPVGQVSLLLERREPPSSAVARDDRLKTSQARTVARHIGQQPLVQTEGDNIEYRARNDSADHLPDRLDERRGLLGLASQILTSGMAWPHVVVIAGALETPPPARSS
ncbi:hypothetical protein [Amycolatopsis sp. cmx-4-83]|uniref:hypothetical protein n=1 Tax=Amycolatopsis sp. cmx-4-83 TaxID=2790940 RepID=UPI003978A5C1